MFNYYKMMRVFLLGIIGACVLLLGIMLYPRNAEPPPLPPAEAEAEPEPLPLPRPLPKTEPASAPTDLQRLIRRCENYGRISVPPGRILKARNPDGSYTFERAPSPYHTAARECWDMVDWQKSHAQQ